MVNAFLSDEATGQKQIISLGAGTDTRPFRLFSQSSRPDLIYHEIDFDTICQKKFDTVQAAYELSQVCPNAILSKFGSWTCNPSTGGEYYCHGIDLRQLSDPSSLALPGLRTDIPTLLLSECCLCYLQTHEALRVINYFTMQIPNIAVAIYEPVNPDDPFGRMMVTNLASRRIHMPTLDTYRTPQDQEKRLREAGFETVRQMTIQEIWKSWVPKGEKERLDELEGLDEVEEWELLAGHYIVVWGCRGRGFDRWGSIAKAS